MSYDGDDKWSVYGDELVGVSTKTLAELKSILKKHIESFGYHVIIVWERDYQHNKQVCERKLINAIKKHKDKVNKETSKSR